MTALIATIRTGNVEAIDVHPSRVSEVLPDKNLFVQALLEAGADVEKTEMPSGMRPLHLAAAIGIPEIIEVRHSVCPLCSTRSMLHRCCLTKEHPQLQKTSTGRLHTIFYALLGCSALFPTRSCLD